MEKELVSSDSPLANACVHLSVINILLLFKQVSRIVLTMCIVVLVCQTTLSWLLKLATV